ncbi:MAG: hypothetical protein AAF657_36120 [Acidobacteriota bacterium]
MSTRTVRLDADAEKVLREVTSSTGWTISTTLKEGLMALRERLSEASAKKPYEIYESLDLGPGGYAIAPSTESRRGVQEAIRRKLGR